MISRHARFSRRTMMAIPMAFSASGWTLPNLARSRQGGKSSNEVVSFRGNAEGTGEMPGPGPDHDTGIEVIWEISSSAPITASAAVSGSLVYFGDKDGVFTAANTKLGSINWNVETGASIVSSPTLADGLVLVGDHNGILHAFDAETGAAYWRFRTDGRIDSSPIVIDTVAYFGSYDGNMYAIDITSGQRIWSFLSGSKIFSSPAISNGKLIFGGYNNNVHALDTETGAELWRFQGADGFSSSPAVANDLVFIGCHDGNVQALTTDLGTEVWRFKTRNSVQASPAVINGVVYIGSLDEHLYAIDATFGTEIWKYSAGNRITSSAVVAEGVVYFGDHGGMLHALDAATGLPLWSFPTDGKIYASPIVIGGQVYFGNHASMFHALGAIVPRLEPNSPARVLVTTSLLGAPSSTGVSRAELVAGTLVTTTGSSESSGTTVWWPVTVDGTGESGWVNAKDLQPLPRPNAEADVVPVSVISLEATDPFNWSTKELSAAPGQVIQITNTGVMEHDFVIDELRIFEMLHSGEPVEVTLGTDLKVGDTYTYYCSIPGHRESGMEGVLTIVEASAAAPAEEKAPIAQLEVVTTELIFTPNEIAGPANTDITITLVNEGLLPHDFAIDDLDIKSGLIETGESTTITFNAPAGSYEFYCTKPGHAQAGMVGTLTIS